MFIFHEKIFYLNHCPNCAVDFIWRERLLPCRQIQDCQDTELMNRQWWVPDGQILIIRHLFTILNNDLRNVCREAEGLWKVKCVTTNGTSEPKNAQTETKIQPLGGSCSCIVASIATTGGHLYPLRDETQRVNCMFEGRGTQRRDEMTELYLYRI